MTRRETRTLLLLLTLALAHGLAWMLLTPPWQHYDEPNHFEYAWLIARRGALPQPGDYDNEMRRAVALSMLETGFFDRLDFLPDLDPAQGPIWIGTYSQLDDPPLYYLLAALPLAFTGEWEMGGQLYAARTASLLLYLSTVLAAWLAARELTAPGSALRWMLPAALALIPGYVELMTAVNNDVGAAACFSWLIWAGLRLVKRGFTAPVFLAALAAAGVGVFVKRTTFPGLVLLAVALLFAVLRGRNRRWAWAILGAGAAASALAVFTTGEAALWVRQPPGSQSVRQQASDAPLGSYAFQLAITPRQPSSRLRQILPQSTGEALAGKMVTLGGWVWADRPAALQSPALFVYDGQQSFAIPITVTTTPQFFSFAASPAGNPWRAWIDFSPAPPAGALPLTVFVDGLTLAEGDFSSQPPPEFTDSRGDSGVWGGQRFENLLRNGSAEQAGLRVRPWADALGTRLFADAGQDSLSTALYSLFDYPATGWYYRVTLRNLVQTFWAKFGWQHIRLPASWMYWALAGVSLLGALGAGLAAARQPRRLDWAALAWLGLGLGLVWGLTLLRGSNYVFLRAGFTAAARYTYPAIIPMALVLTVGWREAGRALAGLLRIPDRWRAGAGALLWWLAFAALDIFCLLVVARYYGLVR